MGLQTSQLNIISPINWAWPVNRGLVSRWKVVATGGLRLRDLCDSTHVALTNGPLWSGLTSVPGFQNLGGSIYHDGSDDYLLGSGLERFNGSETTFSCWIRMLPNDASGVVLLVMLTGNLCYWQVQTTTNCFISARTCTTTSTAWTDGAWRHITMVATAAGVSMYSNGVLIGSASTPTAVSTGVKTFRLNSYTSAVDFRLKGNFNEACIWNRALSAYEVKYHYLDVIAGSPNSLNWCGQRMARVFSTTGNRRRRVLCGA